VLLHTTLSPMLTSNCLFDWTSSQDTEYFFGRTTRTGSHTRLSPKSRATLIPFMDWSVDPNIKYTCWPSTKLGIVTQVNPLPFQLKEEVNGSFVCLKVITLPWNSILSLLFVSNISLPFHWSSINKVFWVVSFNKISGSSFAFLYLYFKLSFSWHDNY
jgi:hypothetical protein